MVIARMEADSNKVTAKLEPGTDEIRDIITNLVSGSFTLFHKADHGDIMLSTLELSQEFVTSDTEIETLFVNPTYLIDLYITYNLITDSDTHTGTVPVLTTDEANALEGVDITDVPMIEVDKTSTPEKEYIIIPINTLLILDINFNNFVPIETGEGELLYNGGGNRYLPNEDGGLTLQTLNQNPVEAVLSAVSEEGTSNLLTNSEFSDRSTTTFLPTGYTYIGDNVLVYSDDEAPEIMSGVYLLKTVMQGNDEIDKSATFGTPVINVASITDYNFSSFVGVVPTNDSAISNVRMRLNFYDASDTLLGSKSKLYDYADVENTLALLDVGEESMNVPVGTVKVNGEIVFEGVDRGNRIMSQLIIPQITTLEPVTSQVSSEKSRVGDAYYIQQENNLNNEFGSIEIEYTPGDQVDFASVLFDTTEGVQNGFTALLLSNGRVQFEIYSEGVVQTLISSDPVSPLDEVLKIKVEWDSVNSFRRIYIDDQIVALDTNPFTVPTVYNDYIYIGCDSDKANQINGKLETFKIAG